MKWCETDQNDFPDREFYRSDGVLMHRSRHGRAHPADPGLEYPLPDIAEAIPPGRDE